MTYKLKGKASREPEADVECRHYWIIEEARGSTSQGICKFCGAKREFHNSWDSSYVGRDTGIFDLPNLLGNKSKSETEDSEEEDSIAN